MTETARSVMKVIWLAVFFCSVIGFLQGVVMLLTQNEISAPQQAAAAAMGIAWAVIPYCAARAVQMLLPREVVIKKD
ncbi:hypothetical protein [Edwardsiella sp. EA181011]|uniref:hypothetical protein n=1 Tax=Edwardsiella sp. EA181011 TaxID=1578828 RepID=UPI001F1BDEF1